jgi:hypothetical protein
MASKGLDSTVNATTLCMIWVSTIYLLPFDFCAAMQLST